jgi:peptidoglycan hydrolase-like protein with peptidoglycan-binding domain
MAMERRARRILAGFGGAIAIGSLLLGQVAPAAAVTSARAAVAGRAAVTVRSVVTMRSVVAARSAAKPVPGAVYHVVHRTLKFGMRGPAVKALQQRLHYLRYWVGKINGRFGWDTQEAVWAFKEVQTGKIAPAHPNRVDGRMQHALLHPRRPRVLFPHGGSRRIEINKKIEVLVLYVHSKVFWISHTSTAAWRRPDGVGFFTPGGFHRALHYIPGKVPDHSFGTSYMYWPVFFIGYTYAVHGFPNPKWHNRFYGVPLKPASHGCVRIPLDFSKVLHRHLRIGPYGTPIWIYPVSGRPAAKIRWLRPGHPG